PRPRTPLPGLGQKAEASVAGLRAALRVHGRDRTSLDLWLAGDGALRRLRERSAALDLALLDGETNNAATSVDYSDFGLSVDLTVPPPGQVLGYPAQAG